MCVCVFVCAWVCVCAHKFPCNVCACTRKSVCRCDYACACVFCNNTLYVHPRFLFFLFLTFTRMFASYKCFHGFMTLKAGNPWTKRHFAGNLMFGNGDGSFLGEMLPNMFREPFFSYHAVNEPQTPPSLRPCRLVGHGMLPSRKVGVLHLRGFCYSSLPPLALSCVHAHQALALVPARVGTHQINR